ncbi:MAG: enoyl-CoA hydratase/isomerase family protein [Loktanella sp.]|nr:enoyl-CoA hydratase/isomerase family protein [Loktanella sp.]
MIRVAAEGCLTLLTLDRPDKANALTEAMLSDLIAAVTDAAGQHALILTGTGRVFSAGADLDAAKAGLATSPLWEDLSSAIARFDGLTIAALNGTCAGGACGMMLACDLRIAAPSAKLFYPVMKLGYLPQPSDPSRLTRIAGPAVAKRILLAGDKLTADDALQAGLFDALDEDPVALARRWAGDAVSADHAHVAGIKRMIPDC